jgi:hypothetical protein
MSTESTNQSPTLDSVPLHPIVSTCPCGDDRETETDEPDFTLDDLEWSEEYE